MDRLTTPLMSPLTRRVMALLDRDSYFRPDPRPSTRYPLTGSLAEHFRRLERPAELLHVLEPVTLNSRPVRQDRTLTPLLGCRKSGSTQPVPKVQLLQHIFRGMPATSAAPTLRPVMAPRLPGW